MAGIIFAGGPKPITASGCTSVAAAPMPRNQIATTASSPPSGSLPTDMNFAGTTPARMAASIVIGMLEFISCRLDLTDVFSQCAHRRVAAETAQTRRGLNCETEYGNGAGGCQPRILARILAHFAIVFGKDHRDQ